MMCRVLQIRCWVRAGCSVVGLAAHSYAPMGLDWDWVCLRWVGIGWHCVCVGLAGPAAREASIGSAICRSPAPFGSSRERYGNRHHTRAVVISKPSNAPTEQPSSQPRAGGHLPHTPSAQFGFYSYRVTVCITAVTRGLCVWRCLDYRTSERQNNIRIRCGVALARVFTFQACSHVRSHRDGKAGVKSGGASTPNSSILTVRRGKPKVWGFIETQKQDFKLKPNQFAHRLNY